MCSSFLQILLWLSYFVYFNFIYNSSSNNLISFFCLLPAREILLLFHFYVFLFGFNFLSTSWLPLFPILICLRSVFLLWTKNVYFLKPKVGDFFTNAWISLLYRISKFFCLFRRWDCPWETSAIIFWSCSLDWLHFRREFPSLLLVYITDL